MKNTYRLKLFLISSALTIIYFIFASCGPVEIKKVATQKADYYKFTSQKAGLKISIDPYVEENRLQEVFGCDLLSRRILPVLVVIENQNPEDGHILVREKAALVVKKTDPTNTETNLGTGVYDSHDLEKVVKIERAFEYALFAGVVSPLALVAIMPVIGVAKKE